LKTAYLALGSNLGDRAENLREAVRRLEAPDLRIKKRSSIYETAPRYVLDQGEYLNAVVEIETDLFPIQLLKRARKVEQAMGRERLMVNGPRNIDIDILFYGRIVIDTPDLKVPHPRMPERRFVLEPLEEIAPELRHPLTGKTAAEMSAALESQGVRRSEFTF